MVQRFKHYLPNFSQVTQFFSFSSTLCPGILLKKVCVLPVLVSASMKAFAFVEISAECFLQRQQAKN